MQACEQHVVAAGELEAGARGAHRAVLALRDAVALLDGDVRARVDVREVEVGDLHRRLPEDVEDEAEAVRELVDVVAELEDAADDALLGRQELLHEDDEVLDHGDPQQALVRHAEQVVVRAAPRRQQRVEEVVQLHAQVEDRPLRVRAQAPEAARHDDAHHVREVLPRHVVERREVQAVVLDVRYAVLQHAVDRVPARREHQHVPHRAANVDEMLQPHHVLRVEHEALPGQLLQGGRLVRQHAQVDHVPVDLGLRVRPGVHLHVQLVQEDTHLFVPDDHGLRRNVQPHHTPRVKHSVLEELVRARPFHGCGGAAQKSCMPTRRCCR